jgi:hypothetical protein
LKRANKKEKRTTKMLLLVFDLIKNQEKKIQKYKRIHMNNAHKIAYVSGEEPK